MSRNNFLWLPPAPKRRETGNQAFYNQSAWRIASANYRKPGGLIRPCEACQYEGKLVESEVVDHIIPEEPYGAALDERNFMALCHVHHNRKSGLEGHRNTPLIGHINGVPLDKTEIFKFICKSMTP
jgi:5-methylcytosine-specific restriction endonuclease McrA